MFPKIELMLKYAIDNVLSVYSAGMAYVAAPKFLAKDYYSTFNECPDMIVGQVIRNAESL